MTHQRRGDNSTAAQLEDLNDLSGEYDAKANAATVRAAVDASQGLPDDDRALLIDAALEAVSSRKTKLQDVLSWIQTSLDGLAASIHYCLEKHHDGLFSRSDVFAWIEDMHRTEPAKLKEIRDSRDAASDISSANAAPQSQPVVGV